MLARAGDLLRATTAAAEMLRSEEGGPDAAGFVAQARALLNGVGGVDPVVDEILQGLVDSGHLLDEAARDLRGYAASVVVDPAPATAMLSLACSSTRTWAGSMVVTRARR